ncbi:hypothetical protein FSOLCH5_013300 [Fusarium solani]|uniref:2EXR domain-containing protein n=2 Tax=Fusarium solani TaxID=169388 RepID=A0A9P9GSE1_FUSSL|nr:uncharacterized protein B0J15DRAFT_89964 [Fusarium solani]KAH7243860.1 hypothetical protein B0J15DRAFT_89964 [Fusarium solani]
MARASTPHPFGRAPPEVRCLIWQATLEVPRVLALRKHSHADTYSVYFEIRCSLEAWLDHLNSSGCPQKDVANVPVALHVCRESRKHTLKTFALFRHKFKPEKPLYVNPKADILQICPMTSASLDFLDDDHQRHKFTDSLYRGYGEQLESNIKNIVMTSDYFQEEGARRKLSCLRGVTRLQVIFGANTGTEQANEITKQVHVMKRVIENHFKSFGSRGPSPLGVKYQVLGDKGCIIKDYPDEATISVDFMDPNYVILGSVKVCRKKYWWMVNHGGGGLWAALRNVGSNEDENDEEDENGDE